VVLAALAAMAVPGVARAQTARLDGTPLDVLVDGTGGLQVIFDGSDTGEFFLDAEDTSNGFALRSANGVSLPGTERESTHAPVVSPPVGGTRTVTSGYDVTTTSDAGVPDVTVHVDETVAYTDGTPDVRVKLAITNPGKEPVSFTAGELADLYAGGSDDGTGQLVAGPPRFVGGVGPLGGMDGLVEADGSRWTHYEEGEYNAVFDDFAAGALKDSVEPENVDNGVGAEWAVVRLAAGATRTIDVIWRFGAQHLAAPVITAPASASSVGSPITFRGTAPPNLQVTVLRDGADEDADTVHVNADGTWSLQYPPLGLGTYTFRALAIDTENGVDSISAPVTLTVTGPPAPAISSAPVSGTTVTLTGTARPGVTISVREGAAQVGSTTADVNGNWTVVLTNVAPGTHLYTAVATDPAGNQSPASPPQTVTVAGPQPPEPPANPPLGSPPPVAGKTLGTVIKSGTIKIKLPGTNTFVELAPGQQIPVGTTVDATHGRITLVAAGGQRADFYKGIFKVSQTKGAKPLTTLTLAGPKPTCTTRTKGHASAARLTRKKRVRTRRLWGSGHGAFRTKGQYSSATVRGTTWLTQDSCAGTLVRVTRGVVRVRDNVRHKTVIVRAGHRYLARAKRR
jgi:hypothetical protein